MQKRLFKLSLLSLAVLSCSAAFASETEYFTELNAEDAIGQAAGAYLCLSAKEFDDDHRVCSGVGAVSTDYDFSGSVTLGIGLIKYNGLYMQIRPGDSSCATFSNQGNNYTNWWEYSPKNVSSGDKYYFQATVTNSGANEYTLTNCSLTTSSTPAAPYVYGGVSSNQGSINAVPIGNNLYRVTVISPAFNETAYLNGAYFAHQIYPLRITGSQTFSVLEPIKLLANDTSGNWHFSKVVFYYQGSGGKITATRYFDAYSGSANELGGESISLPAQSANPALQLQSSQFSLTITPLFPENKDSMATEVYSNGLNQIPFTVAINYKGQVISPDYHPELLYLYQQLYFTSNGKVINDQMPNATLNNYTAITDDPGPYVGDPQSWNTLNSASVDEGSLSGQTLTTSSNMPSADNMYFLSTTNSSKSFDITANLVLGSSTVTSQNLEIDPQTALSDSFQQSGGGHSVNIIDSNNNVVPAYNPDNFDKYNSAAVFIPGPNAAHFVALFGYPLMQGEISSMQQGNYIAPGYVGSAIVNSDGSMTIPDQCGSQLTTVDEFGDEVQGNASSNSSSC